jgi:hypothetical protein
MTNPVFIIGVPRSGTTLLRVILDSHSRIAAAPETPWLLGGYGPVSIRELTIGLIEHRTGPVRNLPGVTSELIYAAALEFLKKILDAYLHAKGKDIVVLKTPDDIAYLESLTGLFPNSTYLHLFRDGRDVACSTVNKKGTFLAKDLGGYGELNHVNAMRRWYDWEKKAREILAENNDLNKMSIRYENLVTKPLDTMQKVCQRLRVDFEKTMLQYSHFDHDYPEWEAGSADVNDKTAIDDKGVGRWQKELSRDDLAEIEFKYGDLLKDLGYTLVNDKLGCENNVAATKQGRFKRLITFGSRYCKRFAK